MTATRAERLEGLTALIQALSDHDELELPFWLTTCQRVRCSDADDLLAKRKLLGRCEKVMDGPEVGFKKDFGGGISLMLVLAREVACEKVVKGQRWEEGYTTPGRMVDDVEYVCPESLIAKLGEQGA